MTTLPSLSIDRRVHLVLAGGITTVLVLLYIAYTALGPRVALQGSYALAGLLLALMVYYSFDPPTRRSAVSDQYVSVYPRFVLAVVAISIGAVGFTDNRLAIVPGLVVGYALVALQLRGDSSATAVLAQIVVLFALSPTVKYLTSGFYFGNWDTFFHVRHVEQFLKAGTPAAIDGIYSLFPGLHALVGAVSLFAGIPAYDALLVTGIVSYAALIVLVFAFAKAVTFETRLALLVALSTTFAYHLSLYSAYFFPQSLAVIFLLILTHISFRYYSGGNNRAWLVVAGFVLATATFTHHLTFILFLPVFLVLAASNYASEALAHLYRERSPVEPHYWPLGVSLLMAFAYWYFESPSFFVELSEAFGYMIAAGLGGSFTTGTAYGLGATVPSSFEVGFKWLVGVPGAYFTALLALFLLGIVSLLESPSWPENGGGVPIHPTILAAGVVGAVFVLRSPLSALKSPDRIGVVWVFFFAFVVAVGLRRLVAVARTNNRYFAVPLVVFVLVLGTLAPLAMPNDFYGVQSTTSQTDFSEREYESLRATTAFVAQSDDVSSFVVTNMALYRFGRSDTQSAQLVETGIVAPKGLFVYRTSWSEYQVQTYAERMHHDQLYVSRAWIEKTANRQSKVYDSGATGVLWLPNETTLRSGGEG
ncbi:hypothetical protein [Haladaptatus salinisoli]|uniref:hypothetical protein n=1 Tax=Haladaptatus salinisoli TaxID=2884876 RepID=UPI001D0BBA0F|nr:hypothetical protein [Haladaptatus salinisoli]